jgi:thioredoxin-like negative regulator of GroEL
MRKLVIVSVLATMAAMEAMAIKGTISTETDSKSGEIKWQARTKTYALTYKKGKTEVSAEFPLADVTKLDIPKPETVDKGVELVEKGQSAAAVAILSKIVAEYRMMVWDKPAGRYLALAYIASNQPQKALDACKAIIAEDKAAAWSGDLAAAYWQALLKLGKTEELQKLLDKAATSGDRPSAAAALVMRGDMVVASGNDAPEALKTALRDGYLRVALMFCEPECARERGEAMLKAAQCFDKLGQVARAERLRTQAKSL